MQMQYQQPAAGNRAAASDAMTQPIVSLSPFLGQNWAVRARVADKAAVRTWKKNDRQGQLMSLTLLDDSGVIRATFFSDDLTDMDRKLVNGQIYVFSRGSIKNANKKFSSVNNDYEVTFDGQSGVSEPQQASANDDIPTQRYNLLPLESLPQREKDTLVDVVFYVTQVEEPREFNSKASNKLVTKRTIHIADKSAMAEITLWGDDAKGTCALQQGMGYVLKGAKVANYQGACSLGVWQLSDSLKEVRFDDADTMLAGAINKARDIVNSGVQLTNVSKVDSNFNSGNYAPVVRRHFDDMQRLNLGSKPEGDTLDVRCIPTFIKTESLWYDACNKCNKKVSGGPGAWSCPNPTCATPGQQIVMEERYMVSIQASDGAAQTWITLFNDAGKEFFGMTAHELKQKSDSDATFLTKHSLALLYKPLVLRLRVKQEMREDNMRTNVSANKCTRILDDAAFTNEIEKMAAFISMYEGASDVNSMSPNRIH